MELSATGEHALAGGAYLAVEGPLGGMEHDDACITDLVASQATDCLARKPTSLSVSAGSPVTNTDTAVVVASFNSTPPALTQGTIAAALSNGTSAAVTAVQAFPGQTGTFLIEVGQPFETSIPDVAGLQQPFWQARL